MVDNGKADQKGGLLQSLKNVAKAPINFARAIPTGIRNINDARAERREERRLDAERRPKEKIALQRLYELGWKFTQMKPAQDTQTGCAEVLTALGKEKEAAIAGLLEVFSVRKPSQVPQDKAVDQFRNNAKSMLQDALLSTLQDRDVKPLLEFQSSLERMVTDVDAYQDIALVLFKWAKDPSLTFMKPDTIISKIKDAEEKLDPKILTDALEIPDIALTDQFGALSQLKGKDVMYIAENRRLAAKKSQDKLRIVTQFIAELDAKFGDMTAEPVTPPPSSPPPSSPTPPFINYKTLTEQVLDMFPKKALDPFFESKMQLYYGMSHVRDKWVTMTKDKSKCSDQINAMNDALLKHWISFMVYAFALSKYARIWVPCLEIALELENQALLNTAISKIIAFAGIKDIDPGFAKIGATIYHEQDVKDALEKIQTEQKEQEEEAEEDDRGFLTDLSKSFNFTRNYFYTDRTVPGFLQDDAQIRKLIKKLKENQSEFTNVEQKLEILERLLDKVKIASVMTTQKKRALKDINKVARELSENKHLAEPLEDYFEANMKTMTEKERGEKLAKLTTDESAPTQTLNTAPNEKETLEEIIAAKAAFEEVFNNTPQTVEQDIVTKFKELKNDLRKARFDIQIGSNENINRVIEKINGVIEKVKGAIQSNDEQIKGKTVELNVQKETKEQSDRKVILTLESDIKTEQEKLASNKAQLKNLEGYSDRLYDLLAKEEALDQVKKRYMDNLIAAYEAYHEVIIRAAETTHMHMDDNNIKAALETKKSIGEQAKTLQGMINELRQMNDHKGVNENGKTVVVNSLYNAAAIQNENNINLAVIDFQKAKPINGAGTSKLQDDENQKLSEAESRLRLAVNTADEGFLKAIREYFKKFPIRELKAEVDTLKAKIEAAKKELENIQVEKKKLENNIMRGGSNNYETTKSADLDDSDRVKLLTDVKDNAFKSSSGDIVKLKDVTITQKPEEGQMLDQLRASASTAQAPLYAGSAPEQVGQNFLSYNSDGGGGPKTDRDGETEVSEAPNSRDEKTKYLNNVLKLDTYLKGVLKKTLFLLKHTKEEGQKLLDDTSKALTEVSANVQKAQQGLSSVPSKVQFPKPSTYAIDAKTDPKTALLQQSFTTYKNDYQKALEKFNKAVDEDKKVNMLLSTIHTTIQTVFTNIEDTLQGMIAKEDGGDMVAAATGQVNPEPTSYFKYLFQKYIKEKQNKYEKEEEAARKLYETLENKDLLPTNVLKVDMRDKGIFAAISFIYRMIAVTIVGTLIEKGKLKTMTTCIWTFVGIYTGLLLLTTGAVNLDTTNARVMLNFFNLHVNVHGLITHTVALIAGAFLITYVADIIKFPLEGVYFVAETEDDRAKLEYKFGILMFFTWLLAILVTFTVQ